MLATLHVAVHGVRFSGARLPVGEDCGVDALQARLDNGTAHSREDLLLPRFFVEHVVEGERVSMGVVVCHGCAALARHAIKERVLPRALARRYDLRHAVVNDGSETRISVTFRSVNWEKARLRTPPASSVKRAAEPSPLEEHALQGSAGD